MGDHPKKQSSRGRENRPRKGKTSMNTIEQLLNREQQPGRTCAEFITMCSAYDLRAYARKMGVDPHFMGIPGGYFRVQPADIWRYAGHVLQFAPVEQIDRIVQDYCWEQPESEQERIDTLTGHIADEILLTCCSTVLEY